MQRQYKPSNKIPKVMNGLGVAILSTSNGVVTDKKLRVSRTLAENCFAKSGEIRTVSELRRDEMSRIGKQPIPVPSSVKVEIQGTHIKVSGSKGVLERQYRPEIDIKQEENHLVCTPKGTSKRVMAFWGMTRSLISNMITGVDQGFSKKLMVEGVGYRANIADQTLSLSVGYSSAVAFNLS